MNDKEARHRVIAEYLASPLSRLMSASERDNLTAAKAAVNEGASVTEHEPFYGRTALHAAADGGSKKVAEYLIASGAELNVLDKDMMTPLMSACAKGKENGSGVALLLLEKGANACYMREADGMDAMKFALWGRCTDEVIKQLQILGARQPGADFRIVNLD
jgi:ankyrin repeat protein